MRLTELEQQYRSKIAMLEFNIRLMQGYLKQANGYAPELQTIKKPYVDFSEIEDIEHERTYSLLRYYTREEFKERGYKFINVPANDPVEAHEVMQVANNIRMRTDKIHFGKTIKVRNNDLEGLKDFGEIIFPVIPFTITYDK